MSLFGKSNKGGNSEPSPRSAQPERSSSSAPKTTIAKSTKIVGDVTSNDMLIIEGELQGTLLVKNHVVVGKSGKVEANMKVQSLQVYGSVIGDVVARDRVSIELSGAIDGNVSAGKLAISEGAIFRGNIDMSDGSNKKLNQGGEPRQKEIAESTSS